MMFVDCKDKKDMIKLIENEFTSFRDQFTTLPEDYDMGLVTKAAMIRYYGILNRITHVHEIEQTYKPITQYVNDIVENYNEKEVDQILKDFSPATFINTLAHAATITEEYIDCAKSLLAYIDTFDSALDLKINIVSQTEEGLNQLVPVWINTQVASRNACEKLVIEHIDVFKHIYPHIAMMTSIIDIDNDNGTLCIYYKVCSKIYCDATEAEPKTDIDSRIKTMILLQHQ